MTKHVLCYLFIVLARIKYSLC